MLSFGVSKPKLPVRKYFGNGLDVGNPNFTQRSQGDNTSMLDRTEMNSRCQRVPDAITLWNPETALDPGRLALFNTEAAGMQTPRTDAARGAWSRIGSTC